MLGAVMFGHEQSSKVIEAIIKLAELAAKEPRDFEPGRPFRARSRHAQVRSRTICAPPTRSPPRKSATPRSTRSRTRSRHITSRPKAKSRNGPASRSRTVFKSLAGQDRALEHSRHRHPHRRPRSRRPSARSFPKSACLPRTHGSALFTRGETQALVVATLGTSDDEQYVDSLEGTYKQNFMLHYNFPPYSVGEAGRMGSPGRREIGHGKLAWRAINPMRPSIEEFPYTHPRRLRDHRIQRLVLDGDRLRHLAGADGCRRADEGAGGGHRHGPDPRRRQVRRPFRHSRRRGSPRRHGLQGRRHRPKASPRCRWTSRSPASPRRS